MTTKAVHELTPGLDTAYRVGTPSGADTLSMQGQTARNEEGPGNARDGTASGAEHARETC